MDQPQSESTAEITRTWDPERQVRLYRKPAEDIVAPSVTTILSHQLHGSDLSWWEEKYTGEFVVDYGERRWVYESAHVKEYTANRGTLCHYDALNPLADRELESNDEISSGEALVRIGKEGMDVPIYETVDDGGGGTKRTITSYRHDSPDKIALSLLNYWGACEDPMQFAMEYSGDIDDLWFVERCAKDRKVFRDKFDVLARATGLDQDSVIDVERYLVSPLIGGQADLIYEAADGAVVLADLKTSKDLREKHIYQGAAYRHVINESSQIPYSVDRSEVWAICPHGDGLGDHRWHIHSDVAPTALHTTEDWEQAVDGKSMDTVTEEFINMAESMADQLGLENNTDAVLAD